MSVLDFLAERKIAEAFSRGDFDELPGAGRPLALDDDPLVPEDLRVAYRIKGQKKLLLLNARVEARYFKKIVKKLGRSLTA